MDFYNEIDPYAADWLENLITAGHIPGGKIDRRSIKDIRAEDLSGFTQCHFFAGIAGWPLALRMAGWPANEPVWSGSCPCQPFSVAGKRKGTGDERHLWPEFLRLIEARHPSAIFGEQVASKDGRLWLSGVRADLASLGYEVGAADLCASGVSAPHIRQRLYWVAYSQSQQTRNGRQSWIQSNSGPDSRMVNADGYHEHWWDGPLQVGWNAIEGEIERSGRKYRAQWRVKPGLSIVVNGISRRMERCSAFGNAIVPQVAAEFIKAFMEIRND